MFIVFQKWIFLEAIFCVLTCLFYLWESLLAYSLPLWSRKIFRMWMFITNMFPDHCQTYCWFLNKLYFPRLYYFESESEVAQSCPTLRNPMDCSLPGSTVRRIFQARVLEWGAIAFSMTERLHFHFSLLCVGEGNGNPLQCSCLENPRDGVSQSKTRLKWLSSSSILFWNT